MEQSELLSQIHEELMRTIRLFLDQLRRDKPTDRVYAILIEVDVSGTYLIRVAGSEESLTRLAEKYVARGYSVTSGDLLESLRVTLRWDAPGDSKVGWYWGNQDDDIELTRLIDQAVKAGVLKEYEPEPLRALCMNVLRELDQEGAFGKGAERERVLIGLCCCECGFGGEEDLEELASLNPEQTMARLRHELQAASNVESLLVRTRK